MGFSCFMLSMLGIFLSGSFLGGMVFWETRKCLTVEYAELVRHESFPMFLFWFSVFTFLFVAAMFHFDVGFIMLTLSAMAGYILGAAFVYAPWKKRKMA